MRVGSSSLGEFPLDVVRIECPSVAIEPEATAVTACWRGLRTRRPIRFGGAVVS